MKIKLKIMLIFLGIILIGFMPNCVVKAGIVETQINSIGGDLASGRGSSDEASGTGEKRLYSAIASITGIAGKILGFLQVITGVLTIVIIASVGFRYIVETPEVKGDIKKTMLPVVTGIIFVFFATSIAKFFMGLFSGA